MKENVIKGFEEYIDRMEVKLKVYGKWKRFKKRKKLRKSE